MNDASAAYTCSMGSCILETLDQGAFSGLLGQSAELLDRERELESFINEILARARELRLKQNANKRQSPALVVAQAPGAGKSHFLAKLGEEIPKLYDLQGNEQIPIVSAFTYNSAMGRKPVHDLMADLVLRILYGAAFHMSPSKRRCDWPQFIDSLKSDARLLECLSEGGVDLAVEILRECYGQRPIVILADEVVKSTERYGPLAEGIVRRALCQAMDTFGSQVFVVMSALSQYNTVTEMFQGSQRDVKIQVLSTLQSDAFRSFRTRLLKIAEERETRDTTEAWRSMMGYRIGLAWGATGGYARAIEAMVEKIVKSQGPLEPDVLQSAITQLRQMSSLPKRSSLEDLECVLEFWEGSNCPTEDLDEVQSAFPETSWDGRVLIDAVASGTGVRYVPTVAPWHAAKRFTDQSLRNKTFSRCERLIKVIGSAYQKKVDAIKGSKKKSMLEASSYLTEVTAAWGVMLAMVKNYDNLPSCIKNARRSTSQIGLDTTLTEDTSLATPTGTDETEAVKKLKMFLQKAIPEGRCEKPFLVMAPLNCMAVDFLVFQDDEVVAVQVKPDTITEPGRVRRQKDKLRKAANTIEHTRTSMNFTRPMQFLAVLGSNYNTDDLEFPCLKQDDLVRLIPPFLRQLSGLAAGVQSLDDE